MVFAHRRVNTQCVCHFNSALDRFHHKTKYEQRRTCTSFIPIPAMPLSGTFTVRNSSGGQHVQEFKSWAQTSTLLFGLAAADFTHLLQLNGIILQSQYSSTCSLQISKCLSINKIQQRDTLDVFPWSTKVRISSPYLHILIIVVRTFMISLRRKATLNRSTSFHKQLANSQQCFLVYMLSGTGEIRPQSVGQYPSFLHTSTFGENTTIPVWNYAVGWCLPWIWL